MEIVLVFGQDLSISMDKYAMQKRCRFAHYIHSLGFLIVNASKTNNRPHTLSTASSKTPPQTPYHRNHHSSTSQVPLSGASSYSCVRLPRTDLLSQASMLFLSLVFICALVAILPALNSSTCLSSFLSASFPSRSPSLHTGKYNRSKRQKHVGIYHVFGDAHSGVGGRPLSQ